MTQLETKTIGQWIHEEFKLLESKKQDVIDHAFRIGELLTMQKQETAHGDWEGWIEQNCPFGVRQGQAYMRLWAKRDEIEKRSQAALLTIDSAIALIADHRGAKAEPKPASKPARKADSLPVEDNEGQTFNPNDREPVERPEPNLESPLPVVTPVGQGDDGGEPVDTPAAMREELSAIRRYLKAHFDLMPAHWRKPFKEMLKGLVEIW